MVVRTSGEIPRGGEERRRSYKWRFRVKSEGVGEPSLEKKKNTEKMRDSGLSVREKREIAMSIGESYFFFRDEPE